LALRRSRRRPNSSSGRRGGSCGEYRSPRSTWRRSKGHAGGGPALVKVGAAFEGRAHVVRRFRGGESTRDVWGVGSTMVEAVPSTSRTTSQVPTVAPQRSEWRSSDRSWRTGLWSQPLWGMEAWRRLTRVLRRSGWHLIPPYGGRASGRAVCPFHRGVASSEAKSIFSLEGRLATLERGGDAGRLRG